MNNEIHPAIGMNVNRPQIKTIQRRSLPKIAYSLPDTLHPVLRRVYLGRDLIDPTHLDQSLKGLLPFQGLSGLDSAVALLAEAVIHQRHVVIVADFDADGATSCALLVRTLQAMGAKNVSYVIPNRIIHGYGLTPAIVEVVARLSPELLVTVDNGISSIEGVVAARALGIQVLITDHHLPGMILPDADAIVNPNCPGNDFSSKCLAGVGVIFYVMLALRAYLRERGWFGSRAEPNLGLVLDLVALGTVADVVPLDRNNRILVAQGLARIRAGMSCAGISALLEVAGRTPHRVTTTDLGFFVGPRLNAAGRLDDMTIGVECLLTDDATQARKLATHLDTLNRERRTIEAEMRSQAWEELEGFELDTSKELPWGLALYDETWHPGVIGILAARIKDRLHRPVIAFAPGKNDELRGSARGIPKLHIRDTLEAIATHQPWILSRFGGHAMAAGLTIPREHFAAFAVAFDAEVRRRLAPEDLCGVILSDGTLDPTDFNLELAELLRNAGPWGQGFQEPIFDGIFQCLDSRIVGEHHLKLRVSPTDGSTALDAIAFNSAENFSPTPGTHLRLVYRLDVNQYRDSYHLQLIVEYLERLS